MKFEFEKHFTKSEYQNFVNSADNRIDYKFYYGKHNDKMSIRIYSRFCNNGIWLPENYLWSIDTTDNRDGYSGTG